MQISPTNLFRHILQIARDSDASDIHLVAGLPPAFRVSGEIIMAPRHDPLTVDVLRGLSCTLLNDLQRVRFEQERELSISHFDAEWGRIRLSFYHRVGIPELAIRMCTQRVRSAAELMLPDIVTSLASLKSGLVLITGPTGMGKTTTMNYLIDVINASRRGKIITIEDPVEYEHAHRKCIITQIEVGTDTLSFASCLRHVLRLNPDVIAVGEMRDMETIETALTAAETGHLVLATLHTPSAGGTVERVIGSFDGQRQPQAVLQLASTLQAVVTQRLVPSVDKDRLILATEVLLANDAVRNLIREQKPHLLHNTISTNRADGMQSLEDSLGSLYTQGVITYEAALAHANRPEVLKGLLGRGKP